MRKPKPERFNDDVAIDVLNKFDDENPLDPDVKKLIDDYMYLVTVFYTDCCMLTETFDEVPRDE